MAISTVEHRVLRPQHSRRVRDWKVTVAGVVFGCSALLFTVGVIVSLYTGGRVGYGVWQDVREDRASLHQARRDCSGKFDPDESGTPEQQYDSCVSDSHTPMDYPHPVVIVFAIVFLATPYVLCLGITGLASYLAWDYRRDRLASDRRLI